MQKTILFTVLALLAFAGNSILCRLALNEGAIDAASFTSIRLLSGALFLLLLVGIKAKEKLWLSKGKWLSACLLFLYAIAFSYSYVDIDTGTGALILFGSVQVTMVLFSFFKGHKLILAEWFGLIVAFSGLLVLLLPGAATPTISAFLLMVLSGFAWAFYTIAGRDSKTPLLDTAGIFIKTIPLITLLTLGTYEHMKISNEGVLLAVLSGVVTSGLGYAIWYAALAKLSVTQAAIFQLTVPIIAAFGGVLFSHELITAQLLVSSLLVLGGIFINIIGKWHVQVKA